MREDMTFAISNEYVERLKKCKELNILIVYNYLTIFHPVYTFCQPTVEVWYFPNTDCSLLGISDSREVIWHGEKVEADRTEC